MAKKLRIPLSFDETVSDLLKVKPPAKVKLGRPKAKKRIKPADGLAG